MLAVLCNTANTSLRRCQRRMEPFLKFVQLWRESDLPRALPKCCCFTGIPQKLIPQNTYSESGTISSSHYNHAIAYIASRLSPNIASQWKSMTRRPPVIALRNLLRRLLWLRSAGDCSSQSWFDVLASLLMVFVWYQYLSNDPPFTFEKVHHLQHLVRRSSSWRTSPGYRQAVSWQETWIDPMEAILRIDAPLSLPTNFM